MKVQRRILLSTAFLLFGVSRLGQTAPQSSAAEDSQARPPVTKEDIQIVQRARQILNSPSKWNRADNRVCPADEETFSLYCALERATDEITANFEHRGAAMQEARFVIDEDVAKGNSYDHRLMDYNNDPSTSFADVQKVFDLLEARILKRLAEQEAHPELTEAEARAAAPAVTGTDLDVVKRVEQILDSPSRWDRASTQNCAEDAKTFGLFCAFEKADKEITGIFHSDGIAINEARQAISETAPNQGKYQARLVDYNNDPTVTFQDVHKLLQLVEERLKKRMP